MVALMTRSPSPAVVVTAFGIAVGVSLAVAGMLYPAQTDFQLFWYIGHGHAQDAYDPLLMTRPEVAPWARGGGVLPYPYPPPAFLVLAPFALLPWKLAYCVWSGAQVGLFALLAYKMLGRWAFLPVLSLPVLRSAWLGQTGLFMTDGAMAAFLLLNSRPLLAGALLGLTGAIKPQSILAVPFALWRRPSVLFVTAVVGLVLCAASLPFGPDLWLKWLAMVRVFPHLIVAIVAPSTLFPLWGKIILAVVGLVFAARDRTFTGFVIGTLFATPYVQLHDLAGVAVIGIAYVREWWISRRNAPMAAIGTFMLICPMTSVGLLIYGLAVIIDRSRQGTHLIDSMPPVPSARAVGVLLPSPPAPPP